MKRTARRRTVIRGSRERRVMLLDRERRVARSDAQGIWVELRDYTIRGAKPANVRRVLLSLKHFYMHIAIISSMDNHPDPLLQFFSPVESEAPDILYTTLDLQSTCSADEIKRAYRKAALRLHPDKHATKSDTVREEMSRSFQRVGFAYAVLGDEAKRKRCVTPNSQSKPSCRLIRRTGTTRLAELTTSPSPMPNQWDGMHTLSLYINVSIGRCSTTTKLSIKVGLPLLSRNSS